MLPVALVVSTIFWYFAIYQKPPSETPGTTAKPTPAVGFGSLRPYATLCKEFQKVEGEISCEEAIRIAEAKYGGKVQSILQGSNLHKKGDITSEGKEVWRLDILLDKPIQKEQEIFDSARLYLDRKTGEEFASRYTKKP